DPPPLRWSPQPAAITAKGKHASRWSKGMTASFFHHARDHFDPDFTFISRNEFLMPASTSSFLANSQRRSDKRLRYASTLGPTDSPDSMRRTTQRSALRQTVRARSYSAAFG